ncbi:MAG TPA: hypothetical protein DC057_11825 [Spirochaetia bacterium]|nr:hypothetical protein [Spirochaetia bacterium]
MSDEIIKIGSNENEQVVCSKCKKEIFVKDGFTFLENNETIYLCSECNNQTEKEFISETENSNYFGAISLGLLAGVIAGVAWYLITTITERQIGYISIGVGFIIGYGVLFGSGKKRGFNLQIISAVITLITLLCSEYFIALHFIRKYFLSNKTEFPNYDGHFFFLSPFNEDIVNSIFSPIGVLIWCIGIYFAFSMTKSRAKNNQ